jgi:hypothetical protein
LSITPSGYQGWLVVCKMPQLIVARSRFALISAVRFVRTYLSPVSAFRMQDSASRSAINPSAPNQIALQKRVLAIPVFAVALFGSSAAATINCGILQTTSQP